MPKIRELIGDLMKEAGDEAKQQTQEQLGLVPKSQLETETPKQAEEEPQLSLEEVACVFDEMEHTAEKIAAIKPPTKQILASIFKNPKFWVPTTAAVAGGAGLAIGTQVHRGKAEKEMYNVAKEYYGLGARNAASYIKEMMLRGFFKPPVGVPTESPFVKTSAFVRKEAKELQTYRKRDEAIKLAKKMLDKGLINQDSFFDKVAELEKEEDLKVIEKAIEFKVSGSDEFGKIAEDKSTTPEPYTEGIYSLL